jgi:hypothetical protein
LSSKLLNSKEETNERWLNKRLKEFGKQIAFHLHIIKVSPGIRIKYPGKPKSRKFTFLSKKYLDR